MEMRSYQAGISEFTDTESVVFGISRDDVETNRKFAESLDLAFPLLSDTEGAVINQYGGMMERHELAKRVTYVVGKDGKIAYIAEGSEAMNPAGAQAACAGLS